MKYLSAISVLFVLILIPIMGDVVSSAVLSALELCVARLIPTLFPCMVLSSLMLSMDLTEPLYRRIPTEKWFGLPRCTASVLLTGFLCGFPVGASGCAVLVRNGKISREEGAWLCALSSTAAPAFVIGIIGGMWSREFGLVLWLTQILLSLLLAVLFRTPGSFENPPPTGALPKKSLPENLANALSSSASACLAVTASVTFFGSAAQVLSHLLPLLTPLFSTFLELSKGAVYGASAGGLTGMILTGAAVGFSGLSVLMQILSFMIPENIPVRPLILVKISAMTVSAAVSAVYFGIRSPQAIPVPAILSPFDPRQTVWVILALGTAYTTAGILRKRKKRTEIL